MWLAAADLLHVFLNTNVHLSSRAEMNIKKLQDQLQLHLTTSSETFVCLSVSVIDSFRTQSQSVVSAQQCTADTRHCTPLTMIQTWLHYLDTPLPPPTRDTLHHIPWPLLNISDFMSFFSVLKLPTVAWWVYFTDNIKWLTGILVLKVGVGQNWVKNVNNHHETSNIKHFRVETHIEISDTNTNSSCIDITDGNLSAKCHLSFAYMFSNHHH